MWSVQPTGALPRLFGLALVLAAAFLVAATSADAAAGNLRAVFHATLAGTFSVNGTVTRTDCFAAGPNETTVPLPPMTVNVSDTTSFTSARPEKVEVELLELPPLFGGGVTRKTKMSIRVRDQRSSGLDAQGGMPGCTPNENL